MNMTLKEKRNELRAITQRVGDRLTPNIVEEKLNGTLGDLLNMNLTDLPRTGAAIGVIAPAYIVYDVLPSFEQKYDLFANPETIPQLERFAVAASSYVNPLLLPAVAMYAGLGWLTGTFIEMAKNK